MASFTTVGDATSVVMADRGDTFTVSLSGTYLMTIDLQKELGSPGSGAWQTMKRYTTENATVSDKFTTSGYNDSYRLFLVVDGGGTCTATILDTGNKSHSQLNVNDTAGNSLLAYTQGVATFGVGINNPATVLTASTVLTSAGAGRLYLLNAAGGFTVTLPAATGSGNWYEFIIVTANSSTNNYVIEVATGGADFNGVILGKADTVTTAERRVAGASDNTISLGGTTQATGGSVGDWIRIVDIATNEWFINGMLTQSGTEATPFSAV